MKKFRIEIQNTETLRIEVVFVEATSMLEACKLVEKNGYIFLQAFLLT